LDHSKILAQIAAELGVRPPQVQAAVDLLGGGATAGHGAMAAVFAKLRER
jgi:hypothetical protein